MRIGTGFDVHAFETGDHLMLGGVRIPFEKKFRAHSDGDVLLHAIADAILGAAAMGDIGQHFPDTDDRFKGMDSRDLLRQVVAKVDAGGWRCGNIDATVIAQAPKMMPYLPAMIKNIAKDVGLGVDAVNVKATTTEHLGFCGRGEGIASMASCLLESNEFERASS